ncbi:MAG: hypothetical protein KY476_15810 [Planctomycetes bacterium]|nr:hypothetical protein [Planctomycetota bacterium]
MSDVTREHRSGGWREVLYTTDPNLAMTAVEGTIRDCEARIDGDAYKRGPAPPRGDVRIDGLPGLPPIPADASGRLELAH